MGDAPSDAAAPGVPARSAIGDVGSITDELRSLVDSVPHDSYPADVLPVPKAIPGTVAFPGGAGVVVTDPGAPPHDPIRGGVMLVGDNVDASEPFYQRLRDDEPHGAFGPGSPGLMATWTNLYQLLEDAQVDLGDVFFTNAYIGLVRGGDPRRTHSGERDPVFRALCADLLRIQIARVQPRLVVALGSAALEFLAKQFPELAVWSGRRIQELAGTDQAVLDIVSIDGRSMRAVALFHPSMVYPHSRFRQWRGLQGYDGEVAVLRYAYRDSSEFRSGRTKSKR